MNNDFSKSTKNKIMLDPMDVWYENEYGNFVQKVLVPQLTRLSALKITTDNMNYNIIFKENDNKELKETKEKIKEWIDELFQKNDFLSLSFNLERKLSIEGNGAITFDENFNLYVPNVIITRVDVSDGSLFYLQVIRYFMGGNFLNVVTETYNSKTIIYDYRQIEKESFENKEIDNLKENDFFDKNGKMKGEKKTKKQLEEDLDFDLGDKLNTKENPFKVIPAEYFENISTLNKRGEPDILQGEDLLGEMLNKIYVRFFWELDFNKSRLLTYKENGLYYGQGEINNIFENQKKLNSIYQYTNDFDDPMGTKQGNTQYFETSNTNLIPLLQIFNYFKKIWWERAGQHQSGSDIGKQISDKQAEMEKGAEIILFNQKIKRRKWNYRRLMWNMIKANKEFGGIGKVPEGLKITDIIFEMSYKKIDLDKEVIENEIMKMQANLQTRTDAINKIDNKIDSTINNDQANEILKVNNKDREKENDSKPIQVDTPSINNPQGGNNKQTTSYFKQNEKEAKND